jgi:transposase InsO family protein
MCSFTTVTASSYPPSTRCSLLKGMQVVLTPAQTPNANAFAERWVRTVWEEVLDHLLILDKAPLRSVLREYVHFYNTGNRVRFGCTMTQ